MSRRKGEMTWGEIDRGWPYQIAVPWAPGVQEGARLLGACPRGHSIHHENRWWDVCCFADKANAERFGLAFDGYWVDPKERGRGHNWMMWTPKEFPLTLNELALIAEAEMCNLYSMTTNIQAIRDFVKATRPIALHENLGNFQPLPAVFPDDFAPIVRNTDAGPELAMVRWGMPSSSRALYQAAQKRAQKIQQKEGRELSKEEFAEMVRLEPDRGTTNVRNTDSQHWRRWLSPRFRCVVPFTSFSEFNKDEGGNIWFAFDDTRPLAFFAGIWAPQWTSVRKIKNGVETIDLFAFLTTAPNDVVGPIHDKAMPVILRTPDEVETWLTADWKEAKELQRPLPDGVLQIVRRGEKQDGEI